ncbi:hypothetical protein TL16_g10497 [Triparma laevis f. inornata]|uniref:Uncharacterized protein n=2 Tax=Triparma laevis TaxID=1534972 RepID=A0A9W7FQF5_9STRA|nr:hypothetical protein TL16_g10497 [Triparma laevis f. inornata]GMI16334.1 hypothetical protein TrLO_g11850 [Triparma laevis f. longispina]
MDEPLHPNPSPPLDPNPNNPNDITARAMQALNQIRDTAVQSDMAHQLSTNVRSYLARIGDVSVDGSLHNIDTNNSSSGDTKVEDEFKGVLTRLIETIETILKLVTAMIKFTIIASIVLSTSSALYHTIYLMTQPRVVLTSPINFHLTQNSAGYTGSILINAIAASGCAPKAEESTSVVDPMESPELNFLPKRKKKIRKSPMSKNQEYYVDLSLQLPDTLINVNSRPFTVTTKAYGSAEVEGDAPQDESTPCAVSKVGAMYKHRSAIVTFAWRVTLLPLLIYGVVPESRDTSSRVFDRYKERGDTGTFVFEVDGDLDLVEGTVTVGEEPQWWQEYARIYYYTCFTVGVGIIAFWETVVGFMAYLWWCNKMEEERILEEERREQWERERAASVVDIRDEDFEGVEGVVEDFFEGVDNDDDEGDEGGEGVEQVLDDAAPSSAEHDFEEGDSGGGGLTPPRDNRRRKRENTNTSTTSNRSRVEEEEGFLPTWTDEDDGDFIPLDQPSHKGRNVRVKKEEEKAMERLLRGEGRTEIFTDREEADPDAQ